MKLIRQDTSFIVTDFKWDKKYTYTKYTRDDEHGPRTYQVNEKKVPSVTTILYATQSEDKKQSLDAWRQRVGYEEAQNKMKEIGREESNKYGMYIKFYCTPQPGMDS